MSRPFKRGVNRWQRSKYCPYGPCGSRFHPRKGERLYHWSRRKYCSRRCACYALRDERRIEAEGRNDGGDGVIGKAT